MPAPRIAPTAVTPSPETRPQIRASGTGLNTRATRDFVLLCSPTEIDLVHGEPLPRLVMFPIEPGLLGVPGVQKASDPVVWRGAVGIECENTGRIIVDPARYGLTIMVDGQPVTPAADEDRNDPRTWYVRRYTAKKGVCHVKVWQRPRVLGSTVLWDVDHEGEIAFRREVAAKILGGIDPTVARTVRQEAETLATRLETEARHRPTLTQAAEAARAAITTISAIKET